MGDPLPPKLGVRNVCKFVSFLGMVLFSEKITNNILVPNFLDALASLERVMSVGGQFFMRYLIKGFTRLRVTDRNRSLIKQDIWSNKTYRLTTIQPYNLKPYKTYNLTTL